jgi:serine/tyrosine/threonine adenylyltransferase
MIDSDADFTVFFSGLAELPVAPANEWQAAWRKRLDEDNAGPVEQLEIMRATNPTYIPRNHLVEQAITAAHAGDLQPFHSLVNVVSHPYGKRPEHGKYALPPTATEEVHQTFCGT